MIMLQEVKSVDEYLRLLADRLFLESRFCEGKTSKEHLRLYRYQTKKIRESLKNDLGGLIHDEKQRIKVLTLRKLRRDQKALHKKMAERQKKADSKSDEIVALLCYGCKQRVQKVNGGEGYYCLCDSCLLDEGMKQKSVDYQQGLWVKEAAELRAKQGNEELKNEDS